MGILLGLIGIVFMLAIFSCVIFFAILMARKIGLLKPDEGNGEDGVDGEGKSSGGFKSYLADFKRLSDSLIFRFGIIAVLVGVMTIPLDMVSKVVRERSNLYHNVLNDIAGTWGHRQQIQGPALLIPYTEKFNSVKVLTDKDGNERKVNKTIYKQRTAIVLPEDLKIDADLVGQTRKRSLYEALVYTADLKLTGNFQRPDITSLSNNIDEIHWDRAWFSLGISDTQAINKVSQLNWKGSQLVGLNIDFEPGTRIRKTFKSGFHAPLNLSNGITNKIDENISANQTDKKRSYQFSLDINVNGSSGFFFSPFGKTTDVTVKSDWPHPSFQGNVLPDSHEVSDAGFVAKWSIPHLARNYPQLWTLESQKFNVNEFKAGVKLFESVFLYSQITRAIKYGVLFFVLTYITFLLFELGIGRRLHVVQYGMIGLVLSMFYLTLLSMAEHAGFFNAYVSAAAIIIIMISLYAYAAIKSFGRTSIITVLLIGLYSLLYSMLNLEDFALLAGTVMLLVVLAVMMYLTRNVGKAEVSA
jgi:inner membrane protein